MAQHFATLHVAVQRQEAGAVAGTAQAHYAADVAPKRTRLIDSEI